MTVLINRHLKKALLICSIITVSACQSAPIEDSNFFGYDFDSAKISYQITGTSTGSTEVWIQGANKKIVNNITVTRADGSTREYKNEMISAAGQVYALDADNKTGTMVKDPFFEELSKLSLSDRQNRIVSESVGAATEEEMKPVGTEQIAGKTCQTYRTQLKEVCLWQGIPLRTKTQANNNSVDVESKATSITINEGVSDSDFQVPSDFQITNLN